MLKIVEKRVRFEGIHMLGLYHLQLATWQPCYTHQCKVVVVRLTVPRFLDKKKFFLEIIRYQENVKVWGAFMHYFFRNKWT